MQPLIPGLGEIKREYINESVVIWLLPPKLLLPGTKQQSQKKRKQSNLKTLKKHAEKSPEKKQKKSKQKQKKPENNEFLQI